MARIAVVDDDNDILEIIERTLRRHGHAVMLARDGREALKMLQQQRPDLVILDVVMPDVNGIQVCRYMRTNPALSSVPILFLSRKEQVEDKIAGFEAGADDYLTKPFSLSELELRVKALLRHAAHAVATGPLSVGPIQIDPEASEVRLHGRRIDLTPVEFSLLYYMVAHAGMVIPSERLLQEVWGYPPGMGNPSLVRMHMLNLRRKIEEDAQHPVYLCTIPRHGYVLAPSCSQLP